MKYRIARFVVSLIVGLLARVEVHGLEKVKGIQGNAIVASNHIGRLDAALVYHVLDRDNVNMLVAEKYQANPVYRWFAKALDAYFVDRFHADLNAVRFCLRRLKEGHILVLAPEGTRSKTGMLIEAKPGTSYIAARSGAVIVPVALTGSEDYMVVSRLRRLRRARVQAQVGDPFQLPSLPPKNQEEALAQASDEIMCRIAALLPAEKRGFYANHPRLDELLATSG